MHSYKNSQNENLRIPEAFESKKHSPRPSHGMPKKSETQRHERSEESRRRLEGTDSPACSHKCNEVLSQVDSSYPTFQDGEEENGGNSIDLVHKSVARNLRADNDQPQGNIIMERMR